MQAKITMVVMVETHCGTMLEYLQSMQILINLFKS